ncbi:MAG: M28 family peptidase [Candidatus Lokiarchaeota archaeon]|nr:M28 family peptidase [Candidatus Lokiarchaeota archaeon]
MRQRRGKKDKENVIYFLLVSYALMSINTIYLPKIIYNSLKNPHTQLNSIPNSAVNPLLFNSTNAYNHLSYQLDIGYRVPGTADHDECADWIRSQMLTRTDEVVTHEFSILGIDCKNIFGKINTQKEKIVIFGAHWDSRAVAEKDPDPAKQNDPIPGANDGASGVAVLMEFARVLYQLKGNIDAQIWFLFIDAEDQGKSNGIYGIEGWDWCEGAKEFTENIDDFYDSTSKEIECFILLDMVGGTNLRFIRESWSSSSLHDAIWEIGRALGYTDEFPLNPLWMQIIDDHRYFKHIGIPSIDLIIDFSTGNSEWDHHHKQSDNLSNIDQNSLDVTGKTIEKFIRVYYFDDSSGDGWNDNYPTWVIWIFTISGGITLGLISIKLIHKVKIRKIQELHSTNNHETDLN